jgi:hypothetical protein
MEIGLAFLPKEKTLVGISYQVATCNYEEKTTTFHEVGIGIGFVVLYLIFYKKES